MRPTVPHTRPSSRAFTLLETLFALVVIGIIAGISVAVFVSPVDDATASALDTALRTVDREARQLASERGEVVASAYLQEAAEQLPGYTNVDPVDDPGLTVAAGSGTLTVATVDVAEVLYVEQSVGLVEAHRANTCRRLIVDPSGGPGQVGSCGDDGPQPLSDAAAPATPTGFTATAGDQQVQLGWDANSDTPTAYRLFRDGVQITTVPADDPTTYTDTGLSNGTTYIYTLDAISGSGADSSDARTDATPVGPGDNPVLAGLLADGTSTAGAIDLSWSEASDTDLIGYRIYRDNTLLTDVPAGTLTYSDSNVAENVPYTYTLEAYDATGRTDSATATVQLNDTSIPSDVCNIEAYPGDSRVKVTWTADSDVDTVTRYAIYRDPAPDDGFVAEVGGGVTTYIDYGVSNGSQYSYWVIAEDAAGNASADSCKTPAVTPRVQGDPGAPPTPQNLTGSTVDGDSDGRRNDVKLQWDEVFDSRFDHYEVYRCEGDACEPTARIANSLGQGQVEYIDSNLTDGLYRYMVTAVSAFGSESAPTDITDVHVDASVDATTLSGHVGPGPNVNSLSWAPVDDLSGIDYYRLQRRLAGQTWADITNVPGGDETSYIDGPVQPGEEYEYRVRVLDNSGNWSTWSNTLSLFASACPDQNTVTFDTLTAGHGNVDGPVQNAKFGHVAGLAVADDGTTYIADRTNHTIRSLSDLCIVSTVAGTGTAGASDGPAGSAAFDSPYDVTVEDNRLLIADRNGLRALDLGSGNVSTLTPGEQVHLGRGPDGPVSWTDGMLANAQMTDSSPIAGADGATWHADGTTDDAQFGQLADATNVDGQLWLLDAGNRRLRKVTGGNVSTVAGTGQASTATGPAELTGFAEPAALLHTEHGLFVADGTALLRYDAGQLTRFAGIPGESGNVDGDPTLVRMTDPSALAPWRDLVLVGDGSHLRLADPSAPDAGFAGTSPVPNAPGALEAHGGTGQVDVRWNVSTDTDGNVAGYDVWVDGTTVRVWDNNHVTLPTEAGDVQVKVRAIDTAGNLSAYATPADATVAGPMTVAATYDVHATRVVPAANGAMFLASDTSVTILPAGASTSGSQLVTYTDFASISDMVVTSEGEAFITDQGRNQLLRVGQSGAPQIVALIADPTDVALDPSNLIVVRSADGTVRQVDPGGELTLRPDLTADQYVSDANSIWSVSDDEAARLDGLGVVTFDRDGHRPGYHPAGISVDGQPDVALDGDNLLLSATGTAGRVWHANPATHAFDTLAGNGGDDIDVSVGDLATDISLGRGQISAAPGQAGSMWVVASEPGQPDSTVVARLCASAGCGAWVTAQWNANANHAELTVEADPALAATNFEFLVGTDSVGTRTSPGTLTTSDIDGGRHQVTVKVTTPDGTFVTEPVFLGVPGDLGLTLTPSLPTQITATWDDVWRPEGIAGYQLTRTADLEQLLLDQDVEGLWRFNEDNSNFVTDHTANGNDGVLRGGTRLDSLGGRDGVIRLAKDGQVPLDFYLDNGLSDMSITAAFKTDYSGTSYSSNWSLFDMDRSDKFNVYVRGNDGKIGFSSNAASDGIHDMTGSTVVNDGEWHVVTVTYSADTSTKSIYVDGQLDTAVNVHAGDVIGGGGLRYAYIGSNSEASTFDGGWANINFDGDIDTVAIDFDAYSTADVQRLHSAFDSPEVLDLGTFSHDEREYLDEQMLLNHGGHAYELTAFDWVGDPVVVEQATTTNPDTVPPSGTTMTAAYEPVNRSTGLSASGATDQLLSGYELHANPDYAQAVYQSGPEAFWRLSSGGGNGHEPDVMPGNTHTSAGRPKYLSAGIVDYDRAAHFGPGHIPTIHVTDLPNWPSTIEELSVSLWVNPDDATTRSRYWSVQGGTNTALSLRQQDDGTFQFITRPDGTSTVHAPTGGTVRAGQWTHLAGTIGLTADGSSYVVTLYVNGEAVDSATSPKAGDFAFGDVIRFGEYRAGVERFDGVIDDTAVWLRTLSADEVAGHYAAHTTNDWVTYSELPPAQAGNVDVPTLWSTDTGWYAAGVDTSGLADTTPATTITARDDTPPPVPDIGATADSNGVPTVSWDPVHDVDAGTVEYRVERSVNGGSWGLRSKTRGLSYTDNGTSFGSDYRYRVRALDAASNNSAFSNIVTIDRDDVTPPTVPTNPTFQSVNEGNRLSWGPSTDSESGFRRYKIYKYRYGIDSSYYLVGNVSGTAWTDRGVTWGQRYAYRVVAEDWAGNTTGLYSAGAMVGYPGDTVRPSRPNITVYPGFSYVRIARGGSSDNFSGVSHYQLIRRPRGGSGWTYLTSAMNGNYYDYGPGIGSPYDYQVRAVDHAGNASSWSGVDWGYRKPPSSRRRAVVGDWDGNGQDGIGWYDNGTGAWFLRNSLSDGKADIVYCCWGNSSNYRPLAGNWANWGKDRPGLYNVGNGKFYLTDRFSSYTRWDYDSGPAGQVPVTGDWDDNGTDTTGYVTGGYRWILTNCRCSGTSYNFLYGSSSDRYHDAGDWDATGRYGPLLIRPNWWGMRYVPNGGAAQRSLTWGSGSDNEFVVGDWADNNQYKPGIIRGSRWILRKWWGSTATFDFYWDGA